MGQVFVVMGVSGCGKSSVGKAVATKINATFLEGDDFHSLANKMKMNAGFPLVDDDRWPWLQALCDRANTYEGKVVITCSALKKTYRDFIRNKFKECTFIYLKGDIKTIETRLEKRTHHYMPNSLLQSQFDILEEPTEAFVINIDKPLDEIIDLIIKKIDMKYQVGLFGLGVMGKSLARNIASRNISVMTYNMPFAGEENVVSNFIDQHGSENLNGSTELPEFIASLAQPRLIILMITAGQAVDDTIELLMPHLDKGDMIVDAGNTFYKDTQRRYEFLKSKEMHFIGMGVSGGEEGALKGPSIMPAGDEAAKNRLLPILNKICAIADGLPCVNWFGHGGGGHFVKMIHNGIEYADMQIISEAYAILKNGKGMTNDAIASYFQSLKLSPQNSYLVDITIDILRKKIDGNYILDDILDVAGHKGTGVWTSITSLELGVAAPTIVAAMNQRILSSEKKLRSLSNTEQTTTLNIDLDDLQNAMLFSRLIALTEGIHIMTQAGKKYDWNYNLKDILQTWRGGCIIRSDMLKLIIESLENDNVNHLFENEKFNYYLSNLYPSIQKIAAALAMSNIACPALLASIEYYKTLNTAFLPINLIQAQRDYFGAHTFKKLSGGGSVHVEW